MRLVCDAQPLVAYVLDERGADAVERLFVRVARGQDELLASRVNLAEVAYVVERRGGDAGEVLADLGQLGLKAVPCEPAWQGAARLKARHALGLGDAFALATAQALGAELLASDPAVLRAAAKEGLRARRP